MDIAFIIGCPRSGTSILGELLAEHPKVLYAFEHADWSNVMRDANGSYRFTADMKEYIPKVQKWYSKFAVHGRLLIHKIPFGAVAVPFLKECFPDAKFIHIVRDGRDVVCSLLPILKQNPFTLGRMFKPPSWKKFAKLEDNLLRCTYAWKEIVEIALDDLKDIPHLQIRYEDLVSDSFAISANIIFDLGLPWTPELADFCWKIRNETKDSYEAKHQLNWTQRGVPHKVRIGRWRENLDAKQQETVNEILKPTLERLGYV